MKKQSRKHKSLLALGLMGFGIASNLSVVTVAKAATTNQTAGGFDLTKQATEATFPVMFDRPSGVNAAALAGAVRSLGTSSELYQSALKAVPELADNTAMNSLLSNALNGDATARATIVKLINWYNSLGGFQLKTQAGATYTVDNLDSPINSIAVGFANPTANKAASDKVQSLFGSVKTVQDVMTAVDGIKANTSTNYVNAFNAYATKVKAADADLKALSQYSEIKPLLDAYEGMYASGAEALRSQLLTQTGATEVAVAFFESAVITGRIDTTDGGTSDSNTPVVGNVTTRWVDTSGKELAPNETGTGFKGSKDFSGYTLVSEKTDGNVRTYTYKPNTAKTRWVDTAGATLKAEADGTLPDTDGNDIPGYTLVSTRTESANGDTVTINTYQKTPVTPTIEKTTDWVDENGKVLKPRESGNKPDTDGNDIPGYTLVSTKTTTDENGNSRTVNTYKKTPTVTDTTRWVDTAGNPLKDPQSGKFPDTEGDDIPGYKLVSTTSETTENGTTVTNTYKKAPDTYWVDEAGQTLKEKAVGQTLPDTDGVSDIEGYRLIRAYTVTQNDMDTTLKGSSFKVGDTINIYTKNTETPAEPVITTTWVDEEGNKLKDPVAGSHPDKEGDDIPGYRLVRVETDPDGNVKNVYEKTPRVTKWVDENGTPLKDPQEGEHPDKEGDDVPGYKLIKTEVDKDGNVTNVYHKLTTYWVDEAGKELQAPKDGTLPDKEGDDIAGYKLTEIRTEADGDVVNVYTKIKNTHWVDESGKALKDSVEGEFPDKEGDDIAGYTFVQTTTDKNGDIVNVYKKVTKTVVTHYVDENGVRLLDDITGEDFAEQKTIDGYTYKEVRTSKDGTEKFYIYTKNPTTTPATPTTPKASLPKTGDAGAGMLSAVGAGLMSVGAGLVNRERRRKAKK